MTRFFNQRRRSWLDTACWTVVACLGLFGVGSAVPLVDTEPVLFAFSVVVLLLATAGLVFGWGVMIPVTLFGIVSFSLVTPSLSRPANFAFQDALMGALVGAGLGGAIEVLRRSRRHELRDTTASPRHVCQWSRLWPLLVLVAFFAVANFLIGPLNPTLRKRVASDIVNIFIFAWIGMIGAQAGLHAIWMVLAPVGFGTRLGMAAAVGLVWFAAWAVGYAINLAMRPFGGDDFSTVVTVSFFCQPLIALGVQAPLWLVRIWHRWRVVHPRDESAEVGMDRFGVRHLLMGMTLVGLALAAARVADSIPTQGGVLVPVVIATLVAAGVSLLTTLPLLIATVRARRLWLALTITLLLDTLVVTGYVVTVGVILGLRPRPEEYLMMASMIGGFFVSATSAMLVVRRLGYRLVWGRPSYRAVSS